MERLDFTTPEQVCMKCIMQQKLVISVLWCVYIGIFSTSSSTFETKIRSNRGDKNPKSNQPRVGGKKKKITGCNLNVLDHSMEAHNSRQ